MTGLLPVNSNTAPVTYVLTDLVPTVIGRRTVVTGEVPVRKTARLSRKVGANGSDRADRRFSSPSKKKFCTSDVVLERLEWYRLDFIMGLSCSNVYF